MSWITTYTGRRFYPLDPRAEDLCIEDIAHALSMTCRFTGHVRTFYSVAEHSVRASDLVPSEHALAALLHDASEAYLADVAGPVKRSEQMAPYRWAERRLEVLICERFKVDIYAPEIKDVDERLVLTELRDLITQAHHSEADLMRCYTQRIKPWTGPARAEQVFLTRYRSLA